MPLVQVSTPEGMPEWLRRLFGESSPAPGGYHGDVTDTPSAVRPSEGWWEEAFPRHANASERRGHACGSRSMLTLVAYDITDPKRLKQIAGHCEDFGVRVQYSVFECRLEADRFEEFWKGLQSLIDASSDRIVAYPVCLRCSKEVRSGGVQVTAATPWVFII